MSTVKAATPGNAFDVNGHLTPGQAAAFLEAGYKTVIRYLPRTPELINGNLTEQEIQIILAAGLSLMTVQHVALAGWVPSIALGKSYGDYAVCYAKQIGLPEHVTIWLDLEEVANTSTAKDVIDYCTEWYDRVAMGNYTPGLYVGWNTHLSGQQLFDLPFTSYWKAYNADIDVPTRGYQIIQSTQKILDGVTFDPNIIQADKRGDLPMVLAP